MTQYCRYCSECIAQDDDWGVCQAKNFQTVKKTSRRKNCVGYSFNEIDAFDLNRKYKPKEKKESKSQQLVGQLSLFEGKENT